jgi:hypothetical protein
MNSTLSQEQMQEVEYKDLVVCETYYIQLLGPFISDLPPDFKTKRKGIVYRKDQEIDELSGNPIPFVQFRQFTDLNTTEISKFSLCCVLDGSSDRRFYLPQ